MEQRDVEEMEQIHKRFSKERSSLLIRTRFSFKEVGIRTILIRKGIIHRYKSEQ